MYAIVETDGRQIKMASGQRVWVSNIGLEAGQEVVFDKVLAVSKEDGAVFGTPYVENAKVSAEVVNSGKARKVMVFKQKPRKDHRKLRGHRQQFTELKIKDIAIGG